ncbi:hypothetical protein [Pyrobaculum sp.]|uniref:hypothetical protein n=1 Tax=Pyrobaculum sp. TaxID=2004705 RepID=UPI003D0B56E9
MSAQDVVVGIIAEAFVDFVRRLCECERLREAHSRDLELAKVADEVTRAVSEGRGGEFGPVVVKVQKKFLGRREVKASLYGREVDVDTLLTELSKAKSRAAWLNSDCSEGALIEALYKYEDRYLIEVAQRNFDKFKKLCSGEVPQVDFGEAPGHVVEGVVRGVKTYLSGHGAGN